jgi:hypothetical protein
MLSAAGQVACPRRTSRGAVWLSFSIKPRSHQCRPLAATLVLKKSSAEKRGQNARISGELQHQESHKISMLL